MPGQQPSPGYSRWAKAMLGATTPLRNKFSANPAANLAAEPLSAEQWQRQQAAVAERMLRKFCEHKQGDEVIVHGLKKGGQYNGMTGVVDIVLKRLRKETTSQDAWVR